MAPEDFKRIWLPLSESFYRAAYYILESESDARDAVQDLYVKLWNSRDSLDNVLRPQTYGIAVLKNLCLDRLRHRKVAAAQSLGDELQVASDEAPPDRKLVGKDSLKRLEKLIEKLPDKQRTVLRLRVFEELEYDRISELTGLSETNLRVLLSAARKTLRNSFGYEKN